MPAKWLLLRLLMFLTLCQRSPAESCKTVPVLGQTGSCRGSATVSPLVAVASYHIVPFNMRAHSNRRAKGFTLPNRVAAVHNEVVSCDEGRCL